MNDSHISWALTLATAWTMVMFPMVAVYGWLKFMDIMRRVKDGIPW